MSICYFMVKEKGNQHTNGLSHTREGTASETQNPGLLLFGRNSGNATGDHIGGNSSHIVRIFEVMLLN